jgi:hypothetical protein
LEEVRKLVDSPTAGTLEQQQKTSQSDVAAPTTEVDGAGGLGDIKRVESTASIGSTHSGKKPEERDHFVGGLHKAATTPAAVAVDKLESVINLGSSLGRFAVRGFTRSTTPTMPATSTDSATAGLKGVGIVGADNSSKGHRREDSAPVVDLLSVYPTSHNNR